MQPILAESAPHRGRAIAFAAGLMMIASLTVGMIPSRSHDPRAHHGLRHLGRCVQSSPYLTR
jgi:hypothetical protein